MVEPPGMDRELRLLLVGVRVSAVVFLVLLAVAAIFFGPRLLHQHPMGGPGMCSVRGNVGECVTP